jgi:uncharacterized LabA/DUF88 family protein
MSSSEPTNPAAVAFVDGQNLFKAAKEAFGYSFPNFDVVKLVQNVCLRQGWQPTQIRFYTGIPDRVDNAFWNHFWSLKLLALSRSGCVTYTRPLRYRTKTVRLPNGSEFSFLAGEEKGIDVRIALDIVRLAHREAYDVALVFSQDQDLSEVAKEVRDIAKEQSRWLKIASAYPMSAASRNRRGINSTDWLPIDKTTYDACLDCNDYRPKSGR